jgi:hypothetical protein
MFAMTKISYNDAIHMIPMVNWSANTTYDRYQHNYTRDNKSFTGANNLYEAKYYARNLSNNVYICLDNNNNSPSTVEPQSELNEPFYTSDGYQWLRSYEFPTDTAFAYQTNNFMPILFNNINVSTAGALYTVLIEDGGTGYTDAPQGVNQALPYYFCNIDGDGTGAVARVTVSNGTITKVEVVRYGTGYTFAELKFDRTNAYASLPDLDNNRSKLNPLGNGDFRSTVIIPPPQGWGYDLVRDLGGTRVGIFSEFTYSLFHDYFPSQFRQIGVLQNAEFRSANPLQVEACYAVQVSGVAAGTTYSMGEVIQQTQEVDGEFKTAKGFVIGWDADTGVIRYTQGRENVDTDGQLYRFSGTNVITGQTSGITGTPTDFNGVLTQVEFVNGYSFPEITKYSGYINYLSNVSPIVRDENQSERVNLIIAY